MLFVTSLHAGFAAQPAALQRLEGGADHGDEGTGARARARAASASTRSRRARFPGAGFKGSPALVDKIALKRVGKPEDIAPMAVAILSEKYGAYMTGSTVVVDGGLALYNWLEASS